MQQKFNREKRAQKAQKNQLSKILKIQQEKLHRNYLRLKHEVNKSKKLNETCKLKVLKMKVLSGASLRKATPDNQEAEERPNSS